MATLQFLSNRDQTNRHNREPFETEFCTWLSVKAVLVRRISPLTPTDEKHETSESIYLSMKWVQFIWARRISLRKDAIRQQSRLQNSQHSKTLN